MGKRNKEKAHLLLLYQRNLAEEKSSCWNFEIKYCKSSFIAVQQDT